MKDTVKISFRHMREGEIKRIRFAFFKKALMGTLQPVFRLYENKLIRDGQPMKAQQLRKRQVEYMGISGKTIARVVDFAMANHLMNTAIQREACYLEENCLLGYEITTEPTQPRCEEVQQRLDENEMNLAWINRRYRACGIAMDEFWSSLGSGPFSRCMKFHHSNPKGHMSDILSWDCAEEGGCCGRDCGCCEKARSVIKPWVLGHCDDNCACCARARGDIIPSDNCTSDPEDLSLGPKAGKEKGEKDGGFPGSMTMDMVEDFMWGCEDYSGFC